MIHPAPTTKIDPTLARGVLLEIHPATGTKIGYIVVGFPNTSYQLHLIPKAPILTEPGRRITGIIRATARRIDLVNTGGKYIEPVYGHPRRVQGRVLLANNDTRLLVVDAAAPIHCTVTDVRQKPSQFPEGELVSFDVLDGATFTPTAV